MAVRPILLFPDPLLKQPSRPVENIDALVNEILTDLTETLYASPGVGLAAPQIAFPIRAIVVDVTRKPPSGKPPPKGRGLIALLNPRILRSEGELVFREGCLSVPDFLANIKRAAKIELEGLTGQGEIVRMDTEGFEAVALQHEIDHLDGILFLDRVSDIKTDLFRRKNTAPSGLKG